MPHPFYPVRGIISSNNKNIKSMLLCSLLPCQPLQVWYSNYEQADPTLFKKMDPIAVGAVILDLVLILTVPCMLGTNMHAWYYPYMLGTPHAYVTQCANTPALLLGLALCPCSSVRRLITNPNGHIPDYFPHFRDRTAHSRCSSTLATSTRSPR